MSDTYTRDQLERSILSIPLVRFTAALRMGISEEDGCRLAREQMVRDVMRALDEQEKPKACPTCGHAMKTAS